MDIAQLAHKPTDRYPWTHRVTFDEWIGDKYIVEDWTSSNDIPGVWIGESFYTVGKYATIIALKFST